MVGRIVLMVSGLASCGRWGFTDRQGAISGEDASVDASIDAVPIDAAVPNFVFATSTQQTICSSGLAAADALCQTRAGIAGLPGTYVAWMSSATTNARDRLGSARGWIRPDGQPFADTVANLVSGDVWYPARIDELGADTGYVWTETASDFDGTYDATNGCSLGGRPTQGGVGWSTGVLVSYGRLTCFGIDQITPVSLSRAIGRLAFVSTTAFAPSTGIAAADTACGTDATAAGLAGTYRAFLPTTTATAASRFSLAGASWVRTDGVALFAAATDLTAWTTIAPLDHHADGSLAAGGRVWSGSSPTAPTIASTCTNWTSNASSGTASEEDESELYGNAVAPTCATSLPVYCLEL